MRRIFSLLFIFSFCVFPADCDALNSEQGINIDLDIALLNSSAETCAKIVSKSAIFDGLRERAVDLSNLNGKVDECRRSAVARFEQTKERLKEVFANDKEKIDEIKEWYGNYSTLMSRLWQSGEYSGDVVAKMHDENARLEANLKF